MIPATRTDFGLYCLRKLGYGQIEIEVTDEQLDDCIDRSLLFYADYHYDGARKGLYKYQITSTDKANGYVTMPANVIGVTRIFNLSTAIGSGNIFNIRYQIALNDLYTFTSVSMIPYYMAFQNIQFIEQLLVGEKPLRYNRKENIVYIDMDWSIMNVGDYLIFDLYYTTDAVDFPSVWGDRVLAEYCTAQVKLVWGNNLSKYTGVKLIGGVEFNGDKIKQEAMAEIAKIEDNFMRKYSEPIDMIIG